MESLLSMIFFAVFCVPAAPLANRGGFSRQENQGEGAKRVSLEQDESLLES